MLLVGLVLAAEDADTASEKLTRFCQADPGAELPAAETLDPVLGAALDFVVEFSTFFDGLEELSTLEILTEEGNFRS